MGVGGDILLAQLGARVLLEVWGETLLGAAQNGPTTELGNAEQGSTALTHQFGNKGSEL